MTDDVVDHGRRRLLRIGASHCSPPLAAPARIAQPAADKLKIGVIGAGHIGGTIGGLWVKAGHPVLFSSRHPEELKPLVDGLGPLAKAGTVAEALDFGDVDPASRCRTRRSPSSPRTTGRIRRQDRDRSRQRGGARATARTC